MKRQQRRVVCLFVMKVPIVKLNRRYLNIGQVYKPQLELPSARTLYASGPSYFGLSTLVLTFLEMT